MRMQWKRKKKWKHYTALAKTKTQWKDLSVSEYRWFLDESPFKCTLCAFKSVSNLSITWFVIIFSSLSLRHILVYLIQNKHSDQDKNRITTKATVAAAAWLSSVFGVLFTKNWNSYGKFVHKMRRNCWMERMKKYDDIQLMWIMIDSEVLAWQTNTPIVCGINFVANIVCIDVCDSRNSRPRCWEHVSFVCE